jgi:UDP-2,3-diacylglucosamine pyrophosphatase LpxH
MKKKKFRSIWISDIHLGTRGCQAEQLTDFLDSVSCENLYLVGDIIDGWVMSSGTIYWPQEHTNVIRKFLSKAKNGTNVYYISGNHDDFLRSYSANLSEVVLGNVLIRDEFIHISPSGKRFLVIHGDQYDVVTRYSRWIAQLGDIGYRFLLWSNTVLNRVRRRWGYGYWSLSKFIKHRVKQAVNFIGDYEQAVIRECKDRDIDGVICGHIHHAEIKTIDDVIYMNDGDWVESCTALVEHFDGSFEIIDWSGNK